MSRVVWTIPALQELDEIADYISLENVDAAKKLVREIHSHVNQLAAFPKSGKPMNDLEGSVYREIVHPPCRVFYRFELGTVYIVHIIRSEQVLHTRFLLTR